MARSDVTLRIAATPSQVWRFFTPAAMQRWYGPGVQLVNTGALQKGAQIRITASNGSREFGYDATVTEYAANRMLTWEGADRRATYRLTFLLSPKEGETVILLRDEFHMRGLAGRLLERFFMAPHVAKYDKHFLYKLKDLVEGPGE